MRLKLDAIATAIRPYCDVNSMSIDEYATETRNWECGGIGAPDGKREFGACLGATYAVPNGTLMGDYLARVPRLIAAGYDISSLRDLERNAECGMRNWESRTGNAELRTQN